MPNKEGNVCYLPPSSLEPTSSWNRLKDRDDSQGDIFKGRGKRKEFTYSLPDRSVSLDSNRIYQCLHQRKFLLVAQGALEN